MHTHILSVRSFWLFAFLVFLLATSQKTLAEGWYLGADLVDMRTTLDLTGGSENYDTQHLRLKLGFAFTDNFTIEARLLSDDTATQTNSASESIRWQTGAVTSVYARPSMGIGKASLYGLIGVSYFDTTYLNTTTVAISTETIQTVDFGIGIEYPISNHIAASFEGLVYTGTADYSPLFTIPDSVKLSGKAFAAGITFRF